MIKNHIPLIMLLFSGLFMIGSSFIMISRLSTAPTTLTRAQETATHLTPDNFKQPDTISPFADLQLIARAAIVVDINTGEIIYAKNSLERLPLASITKVMTALVAEKLIPEPENTIITIRPEDLATEGDSGLNNGQTWRLKDLIDFSLIVSSNDAAAAMAAATAMASQKNFVAAMNNQATDLSLEKTVFKNETGLDLPDYGGSGAQGSAENVARLFAYIHQTKPTLLDATANIQAAVKPINGDPYFIKNTNQIVNKIPGIMASKTGYTDLSGGNLAVIFDRGLNQPAVAVVLGSTQQGRFEDIIKLTTASIADLQIILNSNPRP